MNIKTTRSFRTIHININDAEFKALKHALLDDNITLSDFFTQVARNYLSQRTVTGAEAPHKKEAER